MFAAFFHHADTKKLCQYLALDRSSCNIIGKGGETSGYRKNRKKETSGGTFPEKMSYTRNNLPDINESHNSTCHSVTHDSHSHKMVDFWLFTRESSNAIARLSYRNSVRPSVRLSHG